VTGRLLEQRPTVANPWTRTRLFELTGLLLTYPDRDLVAGAAGLAAAVDEINDPTIVGHLREFLAWFGATDPSEVQQHYVQTFDLRRRSGLYLTYYLHGDTRKRGVALLTLKQRYRAHGFRLRDGELPDLLPVLLEFAAQVGPGDGEAPLRQHRAGIELLRAALSDADSNYRHLLDAIAEALPPLTQHDREALAALAADGPPVEAVGLSPYGSAEPFAACPSPEVGR
jgi:nitrate reductase delta subunit